MNVKKLLQALGATVFTIVFIFVWGYVEVMYTHGVITFVASCALLFGALVSFFYAIINDWKIPSL